MNMRCLLVLGAGLLLAADAPKTDGFKKDEAIKKDKDGMQGTWSVIGVVSDGKEAPSDKLIGAKVVITGNKISGQAIRLGKGNECTFRIDPTQKIKAIDLIHSDGTEMPGIYYLNDKKLRICITAPKTPRPNKLESDKGTGWNLIILYKD
jgi:uncharacterized protein (TIGR03067 family)